MTDAAEHPIDPAELARVSVELAADAFYWIDEHAQFVLVNAAATSMLGYSREELLSMRVFDIDPIMTAELWPEHWTNLVADQAIMIESVHRRADGSEIPVEVSAHHVTVDGRSLNCALVRDLTEREAQRLESRINEALKTATIECALDSVITIDCDGRIVEFNPAAEETFGNSKQDVLGKQLAEIVIPPEMRDAHQRGLDRFLSTGVTTVLNQRLELPALRADGSKFPIEIAISPIDVDGQAMFTAYIRDITERKSAEQALVDARAAAEQASEYKTHFLARMSHEIRTPLTAIVGYADLLTQSQETSNAHDEWHARIQANTRYLLSLVDDILDLSKIEAGEHELQERGVDLLATLGSISAMFRPRAHEKMLDFRLDLATPVPSMLVTDGTKLKQIIVNLLSNAIRATSVGHVGVRVSATPATEGGRSRLQFDVFDTGAGISKEDQSRLFRPFVQLETREGPHDGGTGLGLTICRHFAELFGGSLTLRSKPGVGSTFTLDLEAPVAGAYTDQPPVLSKDSAKPDYPQLTQARILIAYDNPDNRMILRFLLEPTGASINVARNGHEALNTVTESHHAQRPIDVLLLDMQMPVLDGYEVVRQIRTLKLPCFVVAVTAYVTTGDREKCIAAGCDAYLSKPVDPEQLYKAVSVSINAHAPSKSSLFQDQRFIELRADYTRSLAETADKLEAALQGSDTASLKQISHRLKGTGASFGYPEITSIATDVQHALLADREADASVRELIRWIREEV